MRSLFVVVALLSATAAADGEISGFVTSGTGELTGQVTTLDGKPAEATVHIVTNAERELLVKTDKRGNYAVKLAGGDVAYVFVEGKLKIGGQTVASVKEEGGEAIAIREALPPAVPAKPKSTPWIPDYSDAADDANKWTRAWLLLHVSEKGQVLRVKLVNKPGFELDAIAIRDAFKLQFEPARDRANRAISSMVLWTFEWPGSWWLAENQRFPGEVPQNISTIQCAAKPPSKKQRDCSKPDIVKAIKLPWIDRPK